MGAYLFQLSRYFELLSAVQSTQYSEVRWTPLTQPLPKDIVSRFDGKVMVITGYEVRTSRMPGTNWTCLHCRSARRAGCPNRQCSAVRALPHSGVPIVFFCQADIVRGDSVDSLTSAPSYEQYNHHYSAIMTGKLARPARVAHQEVSADGLLPATVSGGHGEPLQLWDVTDTIEVDGVAIPSVQVRAYVPARVHACERAYARKYVQRKTVNFDTGMIFFSSWGWLCGCPAGRRRRLLL